VSRFELVELLRECGLSCCFDELLLLLPPHLGPLPRGAFGLDQDHATHGAVCWLTEHQFRRAVNEVLAVRGGEPLPLPRPAEGTADARDFDAAAEASEAAADQRFLKQLGAARRGPPWRHHGRGGGGGGVVGRSGEGDTEAGSSVCTGDDKDKENSSFGEDAFGAGRPQAQGHEEDPRVSSGESCGVDVGGTGAAAADVSESSDGNGSWDMLAGPFHFVPMVPGPDSSFGGGDGDAFGDGDGSTRGRAKRAMGSQVPTGKTTGRASGSSGPNAMVGNSGTYGVTTHFHAPTAASAAKAAPGSDDGGDKRATGRQPPSQAQPSLQKPQPGYLRGVESRIKEAVRRDKRGHAVGQAKGAEAVAEVLLAQHAKDPAKGYLRGGPSTNAGPVPPSKSSGGKGAARKAAAAAAGGGGGGGGEPRLDGTAHWEAIADAMLSSDLLQGTGGMSSEQRGAEIYTATATAARPQPAPASAAVVAKSAGKREGTGSRHSGVVGVKSTQAERRRRAAASAAAAAASSLGRAPGAKGGGGGGGVGPRPNKYANWVGDFGNLRDAVIPGIDDADEEENGSVYFGDSDEFDVAGNDRAGDGGGVEHGRDRPRRWALSGGGGGDEDGDTFTNRAHDDRDNHGDRGHGGSRVFGGALDASSLSADPLDPSLDASGVSGLSGLNASGAAAGKVAAGGAASCGASAGASTGDGSAVDLSGATVPRGDGGGGGGGGGGETSASDGSVAAPWVSPLQGAAPATGGGGGGTGDGGGGLDAGAEASMDTGDGLSPETLELLATSKRVRAESAVPPATKGP